MSSTRAPRQRGHRRDHDRGPGQTVIAIGTRLWIEGGPTVTVGVISGLGRSMEDPRLPALRDLIQTDAAINPGSSGGPLLNLAGEVIGINTVVVPSAHGIGFAISANTVKPVLRDLMSRLVVRPFLGLMAVTMTPELASGADLNIREGALVLRVEPRAPADAAGLQPGDVITSFSRRPVRTLRDLEHLLSHVKAGDAVDVSLWRDGRIVTVQPVIR